MLFDFERSVFSLRHAAKSGEMQAKLAEVCIFQLCARRA
jgi:hypothetical protein